MEFTQEQAIAMIEKAIGEVKGQFTPEIKSQIDALKVELMESVKGGITQDMLDTKISDLELKMDQFAERMRPVETKSKLDMFSDEIKAAIPELESKGSVKFEVKAITSAEIVAPKFNTEVDPNAKMPQLRNTSVLDLIPTMPLGKRDTVTIALSSTAYANYQDEATLVNVTNSTGAAAETTFSASKIKLRANGISKEALLEDTPAITQQIITDLQGKSKIFLETEMLTGLGATGTPKKIWGIIPQFCTAFDSTGIGTDDLVPFPNMYDLAKAMKLNAELAANDRTYNTTTLIVHPLVKFQMESAKDEEGRPLMIGDMLNGVFTVITSRGLTVNQALLIDPSVFKLYIGRNFEMEIKQDSYPVVNGQTTTFYSDIDNDTYSMIGFFRGMLTMNMADKAGNIYVANITTALEELALPA